MSSISDIQPISEDDPISDIGQSYFQILVDILFNYCCGMQNELNRLKVIDLSRILIAAKLTVEDFNYDSYSQKIYEDPNITVECYHALISLLMNRNFYSCNILLDLNAIGFDPNRLSERFKQRNHDGQISNNEISRDSIQDDEESNITIDDDSTGSLGIQLITGINLIIKTDSIIQLTARQVEEVIGSRTISPYKYRRTVRQLNLPKMIRGIFLKGYCRMSEIEEFGSALFHLACGMGKFEVNGVINVKLRDSVSGLSISNQMYRSELDATGLSSTQIELYNSLELSEDVISHPDNYRIEDNCVKKLLSSFNKYWLVKHLTLSVENILWYYIKKGFSTIFGIQLSDGCQLHFSFQRRSEDGSGEVRIGQDIYNYVANGIDHLDEQLVELFQYYSNEPNVNDDSRKNIFILLLLLTCSDIKYIERNGVITGEVESLTIVPFKTESMLFGMVRYDLRSLLMVYSLIV